MRSWLASLKEVPQNVSGVPVVRELNIKEVEKQEKKSPKIEIESGPESESEFEAL
jgi:hypothetical protein